jgi:hypothetical protein
MYEVLFRALSDPQPAVRAKAVRSLGKLARFGYLDAAQQERVRVAVLRILGRDEAHEWDRRSSCGARPRSLSGTSSPAREALAPGPGRRGYLKRPSAFRM